MRHKTHVKWNNCERQPAGWSLLFLQGLWVETCPVVVDWNLQMEKAEERSWLEKGNREGEVYNSMSEACVGR